MTLTQLSAFVLVARLGSVKARRRRAGGERARGVPGARGPAQVPRDPLLTRGGDGMTMTGRQPAADDRRADGVARRGGRGRGAVGEGRPRAAAARRAERDRRVRGRAAGRRVHRRVGGQIEVSRRVSATAEMAVLVSPAARRHRDRALPRRRPQPRAWSASRSSAVGWSCSGRPRRGCAAPRRSWPWLVDPSGDRPGQRRQPAAARPAAFPSPGCRCSPTRPRRGTPPGAGPGCRPRLGHLAVHQLRRRELHVVDVAGHPGGLSGTRRRCRSTGAPPRRGVAAALPRHPGGDEAAPLARAPGCRRRGSSPRST